ncbi:hypothetical protein F7734_13910 [Scytonema sp. UIC 10036]|uniref:hypothetical protein n=1 Tax=Scytonema sp. UIC 10036 TaxID=2304196 RepID=UPI0012DA73C0|nr:hypothetical protein [Scytonema sp. UIC 10036]MUG93465.1 hypothetical protein [Scytonema sp. UIC 10036]
MESVEFQVIVKNGIIEIPQAYQEDVQDADFVKVVVMKKARKKRISPNGFFAELARNPVEVEGFLTREEVYDRKL